MLFSTLHGCKKKMIEAEIVNEIIGLVPQWYQAECGSQRYSLTVGGHREFFYNHRKLTPLLAEFLSHIQNRLRDLQLGYFDSFPSLVDVLLESFAIEWLHIHAPAIDWKKLVKYLDETSRRTFENQPVALNLVIRASQGQGDITQTHWQKLFDKLASSPFAFLAVDPRLQLIEYGEVGWSQVNDDFSNKFYPEILHPIHCVLNEGDFSAHLTPLGDLVFMDKDGLLAARRKRKWKIYDVRTFKNSLAHCLGNPTVGANLFEIVFDMSFARSGALLVYDPQHKTRQHLRNPASIVFPGWNGHETPEADIASAQALIGRSLVKFAIGEGRDALKSKRRLIELASVDGAVIFDDRHLLAVGAIIEGHSCVGSQMGARATAARSAYLWGAHPVKVSSDGEVTVYFTSRKGREECEAVMHFL
jgi:hypothetical protein